MRKSLRKFSPILPAGLVLLVLFGCASYQTSIETFRTDLKKDQPDKAAKELHDKAWKDGDDQVVYLLEYATAEQLAKNYKESIRAFLRAEDLTDIKDYHSISRIAGSLVLNQGMIQYKGENYEKVLINAMLAIDYLALGQLDEAMVETRKLNDKLYKFRYEGKKNYDQNPFAFYLSALIEEMSAIGIAPTSISKKLTIESQSWYLKEDLIRAGIQARRMDDVDDWRKKWPDVKPANFKEVGEIVLVYQQGWGPQKKPNPSFPRVPKLYPLHSNTQRAKIEVENAETEMSETAMSVTDVAIKTLDDDYAALIGMRAAGIATKAVIADQIRQHNELLGMLAFAGLNAARQSRS